MPHDISADNLARTLERLTSVLPKKGRHSLGSSLTRAQSIDSLASQNMTNLIHDTDCHRASMTPLRPGHAVLPVALFLGVWFSFCAPTIMVVQAAPPSEPATVDPSTLVDENAAAEDDPDANLVPLDTEGPPPEATNPPDSNDEQCSES